MAQVTSGSVTTNSITAYGNTASFTLNWSITQSIETNKSTLSWNLVTNISPATGNYRTVYNASATIDGTKTSSSSRVTAYNGTVLLSDTKEIEHNPDGTKSINISVAVAVGQNAVNCTGTETFELKTIARASEPSCNNVTLGNAVTINTNRKSESFTHTIQILVNNSVKETFTDVGASKSWTPSISTYAPLNTSGTFVSATIKCITYSGSTKIGSDKTCDVTLTIPNNTETKPSVNIEISEANATMKTKNWGIYVQNKSQLAVKLTGSAKYNASISSYSANANNGVYSSSEFTTNVLTASGNQTVLATSKDSRGFYSDTESLQFNVVPYANPIISKATAVRCLEDGTEDDDGTFLKYSFVASVSSVNNKNSAVYKIGYKKTTESTYKEVTISSSGYSLNNENKILSGVVLDTNSYYDIAFIVQDAFTTNKIVKPISSGFYLMHYNKSGKSMSLGGTSVRNSTEKALDVQFDTYIHNKLYLYDAKNKKFVQIGIEIVDEW